MRASPAVAGQDRQHAVGADAEVPIAQRRATAGSSGDGSRPLRVGRAQVDDEEVVAQTLYFREGKTATGLELLGGSLAGGDGAADR